MRQRGRARGFGTILFHFASIDEPSGYLNLNLLAKVLGPSWRSPAYEDKFGSAAVPQTKSAGAASFSKVLGFGDNFAHGSLAETFGVFIVYVLTL